jgi:alpha-beta hydrolase superfamily lysophospholipase
MLRPLAAALLLLAVAACGSVEVGVRSPPLVPGSGPLPMHAWPAEGEPRAAILALHGFGDAGDLTFGWAAERWAGRGIAVYAPDQRGFGANPDAKRWPGTDALVADAVATAAAVRRRHPDLPLVVVGHSMGGGVALAAAAAGMEADALVLAGPAIAGGDALNPIMRTGAWTMAAALPDRRWTGRGLIEIHPTDNPAAIRLVLADPRHFGDASSRELYGLVRVMDRAARVAPTVTTPTLVLIGVRDEVLRPDRIVRVAERIPGLVDIVTYPDGWHWLFRDRQAPRVWDDVADFALSVARRRAEGP